MSNIDTVVPAADRLELFDKYQRSTIIPQRNTYDALFKAFETYCKGYPDEGAWKAGQGRVVRRELSDLVDREFKTLMRVSSIGRFILRIGRFPTPEELLDYLPDYAQE